MYWMTVFVIIPPWSRRFLPHKRNEHMFVLTGRMPCNRWRRVQQWEWYNSHSERTSFSSKTANQTWKERRFLALWNSRNRPFPLFLTYWHSHVLFVKLCLLVASAPFPEMLLAVLPWCLTFRPWRSPPIWRLIPPLRERYMLKSMCDSKPSYKLFDVFRYRPETDKKPKMIRYAVNVNE